MYFWCRYLNYYDYLCNNNNNTLSILLILLLVLYSFQINLAIRLRPLSVIEKNVIPTHFLSLFTSLTLCPFSVARARSGMFKWMISGHKGHKHKQEKLNNAVSQKNKNNLKQLQQQQEGSPTEAQEADALHITESPDCTVINTSCGNGQVNNNHQLSSEQLSQQQQQLLQLQQNGDINQNLEKCDNNISTNG